MSITNTHLLSISEALSDKVALGGNIDFVFPTPTNFKGKADFWACVKQTNDTRKEIETDLIRAAWIDYLNFEDEQADLDSPLKTLIYQVTVFHEHSFERLDETSSPDPFQARVLKTYQEHLEAIFGLLGEFQGVDDIAALSSVDYAVKETMSLAQEDETERLVPCEFMVDETVTGSQTRLLMPVRLQIAAC